MSSKYLEQLTANNKTIEEGLYHCKHIKSFQKIFNENTQDIEIEDIKNVLSSRDNESRDVVSNNSTYASVIYELSGKSKFIIAPGRSHEKDYIEIKFE
jgi:hypothetical protein